MQYPYTIYFYESDANFRGILNLKHLPAWSGAPERMKYIGIMVFVICLFAGSGCTSVKSVPMITEEENLQLLELARARKSKNKEGRLVIGVKDPKDDDKRKDAERLMTYFEMTDYVREVRYLEDLSGRPDYVIDHVEPYQSSRVPLMVTIPLYILSLGVIPMYTYVDWGYEFTLRSAMDGKEIPVTVECHTYGFSGWFCLIMNWVPGWRPHSISGEYQPLEADCRIILQLEEQKNILKTVPGR